MLLCANQHFTGVTVTFYRCFGRLTGFRDGQGELEAFHLNAFLYVLKKHLCEEKNKREIPLALYIRLEYSDRHTHTISTANLCIFEKARRRDV